ncbi:hypothetical protein SUGI_0311860 [Cryptomeria japonica]|uniref:rubisco accumulation factor 1.1, chloroplastic n=1 Tax=Cryptomeria japonica TaxID=3369 RepID=UPI002408C3FD|nr:rubisco accumulation factor 1.1, chloroplastic [Cryptomeria japonica]GLJ17831.1 hypothetical protein SUGI_0311860 [Cryptomeria japonica]
MLTAKTVTATYGTHPTVKSKTKTFNSAFQGLNRTKFCPQQKTRTVVCTASEQKELYQPFRPPPTVQKIPHAAKNLSTDEQLNMLRDRIGLWHQYAEFIPPLSRAGFAPSKIEEATGISGVEQNKIVVASRVRSSLLSSGLDENALTYFDSGGADILYEFRTLSSEQRRSAAEFALENRIDGREARDLVKAMKEFERRRKEGWESFSPLPGDCLAYSLYCQSKEYKTKPERESALSKALAYAVTEKAKTRIQGFLDDDDENNQDEASEIFRRLVIVRLMQGEVSEAKVPLVLPVIDPNIEEFHQSPSRKAMGEGPFRIYKSEASWKSWVVLPGWEPLISAEAPVLLCFPDANVLPWRVKEADKKDPILVAVDKTRTEIDAESFFLVTSTDNSLTLKRGSAIPESAGSVLGMVVLVVRPPRTESDELEMEDWE